MSRCWLVLSLMSVMSAESSVLIAADPSALWRGRSVATAKPGDKTPPSKPKETTTNAATPAKPAKPGEPDWLRRLDNNDRATLRGGWTLQNWSGGMASQTTAGDHGGTYAPNTYQGRQFQQWSNVSTRQDVPSWNAGVPTFPRQQWSHGYVSPNNYFGADAQQWGNMSPGRAVPNPVTGGWIWR